MIGHKVKEARAGNLTRRCKAVTSSGPCRMWTEYDYCHLHEWKNGQVVLSTKQSMVMLLRPAMARLARIIDEPDSEVALKGIMVTLKYIFGDKPVAEGLGNANELAHLTQEELIAKAQQAIAALQHPSPEGGGSGAGTAAAVASPSGGLSASENAAPGTQASAALGAVSDASDAASEPSETAELNCGCA